MNLRTKIEKILEWTLVALMSTLVLVVLWQVISRYIVSSPSSFTDELAGFLLMWVGLLGAAYVAGKRQHLAIDLLIQRSGPKRKFRLEILIACLIILFAVVVLTIGGAWLTYTRFYLSATSAALELPLVYVYLVLPISGILTTYFEVDNIRNSFKEKSNRDH